MSEACVGYGSKPLISKTVQSPKRCPQIAKILSFYWWHCINLWCNLVPCRCLHPV